MGIGPVAFALKLTKDNRVGFAASETSPSPSLNARADDAGVATAEQQQVVRPPLQPREALREAHVYPLHLHGALTYVCHHHTL